MRRFIVDRRVTRTILLVGLLFLDASLFQAQSSLGYALKTYAISSGGESTISDNYALISTLGQPSPVGISSSDLYVNHAGFWFTAQLKRMLFLPLILRE
jgi:hypothetical protein